MLLRNAAAGRAADLDGLVQFAVRDAAADIEDHLPYGRAHGNFDQAGTGDFARQREDFGSLAGLGPHSPVRLGTAVEDDRDVGQRLHVVDDRRLAKQSLHGGKWGSGTRHAPAAFNAVDQGRLFAANKRPRPHLDHHLQGETGSQDI